MWPRWRPERSKTMAKIYVRRIKAGLMTIDDVPARWREQVEKLLEDEGTV